MKSKPTATIGISISDEEVINKINAIPADKLDAARIDDIASPMSQGNETALSNAIKHLQQIVMDNDLKRVQEKTK